MFSPRVPTSVLTSSRGERTSVALVPVDAAEHLPPELAGHYFLVAPVGSVANGGRRPYVPQTTVMNGDGLVARVDFANGTATLTSRLARTPDFLADELTQNDPLLGLLRFREMGIARVGPLGARDFVNTAFLPAWPEDGSPRELYLTYDSGRPYAVDPVTLDVRAPLGGLDFWQSEAFGFLPFPIVLTPAHPAFDPRTGEVWTVNYVRSMDSIVFGGAALVAAPLLPHLRGLATLLRAARAVGHLPTIRFVLGAARKLGPHFAKQVGAKLQTARGAGTPSSATWVVRRSATGTLSKVRLVTTSGEDVAIRQSVHQVAVTSKWFVLMDTAFKLGLPEIYNDPLPEDEALEELLRVLFTRPQEPDTVFWVVSRADVDAAIASGRASVVAQRVDVPVEATHFLADFDDAGGIVFHVGHAPATDLSEWVRPYDRNRYDGQRAPRVGGYLAVGAMDVGRLGRYVVDGATGRVTDAKVLADDLLTWSVALYAARDVGNEARPPARIEKLFWSTEGVYPELLTQFVYDLYADYPHRITPLAEIDAMGAQGGRKSAILRVDTGRMVIEDSHVLADGAMPSSLQFVSRPGATGATDGWLLATIFSPEGTQLWVWDAASLGRPVCRLQLPEPSFGFSLHCAWLPSIADRPLAAPERDGLRAELEGRLGADDSQRRLASRVIDSLRLR